MGDCEREDISLFDRANARGTNVLTHALVHVRTHARTHVHTHARPYFYEEENSLVNTRTQTRKWMHV